MARKLIDQDEAARMLGLTPEQVGSLRDRKKLFPYRDGGDWKFKLEDIERYREEMQAEKPAAPAEDSGEWGAAEDLESVEMELGDDLDSILLSELELGKSSTEGASTIIGKVEEAAADADLSPAAPKKPAPAAGDSGITLANEAGGKGDSAVTLSGESSGKPDSAVSLGGDSGFSLAPGGSSGFSLAGDSGVSLGSDVKLTPGGTQAGKKKPGSSDKLFGSDALKLSDDELSLIDAPPPAPAKPAESSRKSSGSSIKLGDEELEVVLGGSKAGSDITQSPSDSGIQLISASDSGLSLDQPLALGSSARRLLDMPDDGSGPEAVDIEPSGEKVEDDFLLTAVDETGGEESSDSGSQVIALDTDDELSSGMFAPMGGAGLLEEAPTVTAAMSGAAVLTAAPVLTSAPAMMPAMVPAEAPFSGANVAGLAVCVVLLLLCGMMAFDLVRNMSSWDGPYTVNSSILESLGNLLPW